MDHSLTNWKFKGKNYLLVIGIDNYLHCARLSNAVRDAQDVKSLLCDKFNFENDDVIELYDADATHVNIKKAFRDLGRKVTPDADNLVTFFSGHGHYDSFLEEGYWVPVDAKFQAEVDYISYSYLTKVIKAIPSHHTLFIVDSCYSGATLVSHRDLVNERVERDPSRWMFASGRNEVVPDGNVGGNSPFTEELIDTLQRYSSEGLRVSSMIDKVLTAVSYNSAQTPIGRPIYGVGDKGGEFVFHPRGRQHVSQSSSDDTVTAKREATSAQPQASIQKILVPEDLVEDARELIRFAKIDEALETLFARRDDLSPEFMDSLTLVASDHRKVKNDVMMGVVSYEESTRLMAKINLRLLQLLES